MLSACSGRKEARSTDIVRWDWSPQNKAYLEQELAPACVRQYRSEASPVPAYQRPVTESAAPPGDNGRDRNVLQASTRKCCDKYRQDLGIPLLSRLARAEAM